MKRFLGVALIASVILVVLLANIALAARDIESFAKTIPNTNVRVDLGNTSDKNYYNNRAVYNIDTSNNRATTARKAYLMWADVRDGSIQATSTAGNDNRVQYNYNPRPLIPYVGEYYYAFWGYSYDFYLRGATSNSASQYIDGSYCADENENTPPV